MKKMSVYTEAFFVHSVLKRARMDLQKEMKQITICQTKATSLLLITTIYFTACNTKPIFIYSETISPWHFIPFSQNLCKT